MPASLVGPVDRPPCNLHRPLAIAGFRQGCVRPPRGAAPQSWMTLEPGALGMGAPWGPSVWRGGSRSPDAWSGANWGPGMCFGPAGSFTVFLLFAVLLGAICEPRSPASVGVVAGLLLTNTRLVVRLEQALVSAASGRGMAKEQGWGRGQTVGAAVIVGRSSRVGRNCAVITGVYVSRRNIQTS